MKFCKNCEKEITKRRNIFCNNLCQLEHQYKEYIKRWLSGLETGNVSDGGENLSNYVRKYLFVVRGRNCEQCSWDRVNPKTGKCPVTIDHIDGDYKNSSIENLRILCPNCHSLTETYMSLNTGNGRKRRREKYGRIV